MSTAATTLDSVTSPEALERRATLVGVLEFVCQEIDLTAAQYSRAIEHYTAAGNWIASADDYRLKAAQIYSQGSVALETAIRPLMGDEFDVDSVDHLSVVTTVTAPAVVKQIIGNRLRANHRYANILEEKPRCWRLNFKGDFHLDITPSIPNPACTRGGELVPDRTLQCWKPTNPKAFITLFRRRSALAPSIASDTFIAAKARAAIENLPTPSRFKSFLRRAVQLQKRHRDVFFVNDGDLKPISVIISTLTSRSYERCVTNFRYHTEFDLLCDVIAHMTDFLEITHANGFEYYAVWNETTDGENFAEKWNADRRLSRAFHKWHTQLQNDLRDLSSRNGIDEVTGALSRAFGEKVGPGVGNRWADVISNARAQSSLRIVAGTGLIAAPMAHSTHVKQNIFHGL